MADLASGYAGVLGQHSGGPLDVVGVSAGGSLALQLAADHPGVVRRLVRPCSRCRQSPQGRDAQRTAAALLRTGRPRQANATVMSMIGGTGLSRRVLASVGWLLGGSMLGTGDPDMLATLDAGDAFDLTPRLGSVTTPTLVAGGDQHAFSLAQAYQETAALLPDGHLMLPEGNGHVGAVTGTRLTRDVLAFPGRAPGAFPGLSGKAPGRGRPADSGVLRGRPHRQEWG
jgi:pimeloyl-ACP methyl ester carboxylesterase